MILQENLSKVLKCYNFLCVQRLHNCSPAASFANCVMTRYLLKVHLQKFLSIPITQKCQIFCCVTIVANELFLPDKLKCFATTFGSKTIVHIKKTVHYYFEVTDLIIRDKLFIFTDREIQRREWNLDRRGSCVMQQTVRWGTTLTVLLCVCGECNSF